VRSQGGDLRLLIPALAGWAACGVSLGSSAALRVVSATALLLLAAAATTVLRRHEGGGRHAALPRGRAAAAATLVVVTCGITTGASGLHALVRDSGSPRELARQRAAVVLEGVVAADPRSLSDRSGTVLLRLAVRRVDGRGQRSVVHARVLVFADSRWAGLHWGETVVGRGRLAPARQGDDVVATFAARGPPRVVGSAGPGDRLAERMRSGLRAAAHRLPADPRGLLPGLVVGDTSLQPAGLGEAMQATGLTHLAAVSGTNTTLVCVLALAGCRAAGLGRRARLVVAAGVLVGFVALARPEPSVLRAAVMGALGLLGLATARRRAAVPALSTAVLVLLVVDPWLARSYGFALSVLATAGLLLLAPVITERLARRLPRSLATALAVPLAAQLVCAPVVVLLSGRLSLVSVAANLLAEPLVAPATVLGLAAAVVSAVSPGLAGVLAQLAGLPCLVITGVARLLARVPHAQVPWPGGAAGAVSLAVLSAIAVVVGPRALRWAAAHRGPAAASAVVLLALAVPVPGGAWPPPGWVLVACDVGQGDALVLSTGPGRAVLVDTGPEPAAVDRCLRGLGVRTLDLIVLTHFHADHVGGLSGALAGRRVGSLLVTVTDDPAEQARRVRATASRAGLVVRTVTAGEQAHDGPVSWQVLWPERVIHAGSVPNNASIVLDVRSHGLRLLLLGDVEPAAARVVAERLRTSPQGPRVDVLKVAHHGSALQDPALIAEAAPRLALISVGAHNDYGHPSPVLLRLLAGQGVRTARTDHDGDLAILARQGAPVLASSGPHASAVGARR
jgi:competence protein ComEC